MSKEFVKYIDMVANAHQEHVNQFGNKERLRQDGTTIPYFFHPTLCAMMLYMETDVAEDIRIPGAIALLFHDQLEDTTVPLPDDLPADVKELVVALTVEKEEQYGYSSWEKEKLTLLEKPLHIQLLKLYDKTATLYDGAISKKKEAEWVTMVEKLAENVEKEYGTLRIVLLAQSLVAHYRKNTSST